MNLTDNFIYFKPKKACVTKMGHNGAPFGNGFAFAFDAKAYLGKAKEIGVIIYDSNDHEIKIPFSYSFRNGSLLGVCILGMDFQNIAYNFYADEDIVLDPYAKAYENTRKFGVYSKEEVLKAKLYYSDYDWENDINPKIQYNDLILYGLNVRAFTMHSSSKVKNKGTFEGIIEKIPYLKSIGINGIVLMPAYEFDECESYRTNNKLVSYETNIIDPKINCWGFLKGLYYAPKTNYSAKNNPVLSFKNLVKECHKNDIEVFMHFYFPQDIEENRILDIISFWAYEYHVDGFRISGFNIPYLSLVNNPALSETKLWFQYYDTERYNNNSYFKNIACDNNNFRYDIRRFNKGDEGLLEEFIKLQKSNPSTNAVINYICDYDGFSLYDLYSYDYKHNEDNGEANRDGNDYNYSWNCGIEGDTRKKAIIDLRKNQIKNALSLLLLSEGTPYIFSGDEFGNSRNGNNNAYCQDNDTFYVKWKTNAVSKEILDTFKQLIDIRKNNELLHNSTELTNLDNLKCGYPDLSYHGFEAWRPDLTYNSRTIGLLFYGPSISKNNNKIIYIGINMHWENHRIAVPKIGKSFGLVKIFDTSNKNGLSKDNEIPVMARSISVYELIPKEFKSDENNKYHKASKHN